MQFGKYKEISESEVVHVEVRAISETLIEKLNVSHYEDVALAMNIKGPFPGKM